MPFGPPHRFNSELDGYHFTEFWRVWAIEVTARFELMFSLRIDGESRNDERSQRTKEADRHIKISWLRLSLLHAPR